ncbi:MAG: hypothetical protein OEU90_02095 [Gammaproteobacteria bacterium]|nr:hypothetical protein [Gammaproteobacteria bacterium]MDH3751747.1 hypothetical protein [Gammaproteobacteria bacterium]MDH3804242.1 hypothetical protein [Gammaproteobacteria bacterium]
MQNISSTIEEHFEIVSVKPAETPTGMEEGNWHCYEIAQGPNIIRGYRLGSRRAVVAAAEEIVSQLNERRLGKRAPKLLAKAKAEAAKAAGKEKSNSG